ncbi:MAG: ABC transporter substrate-binding protein [Treponema sp.]|jgi:ABC-type nitrate/sulfonate/bicarbonate transport system substrate-binding protein|nr:ABC transporter substrate-binding protein [Treponema sp.]
MAKKNGIRKNVYWNIVALVLAVGIIAGCTKKAGKVVTTTVNTAGQEVYKIKTWSKLDCTGAPYFVGENNGFFKEEGIEIVYTGDTEVPIRVASILHGDNDVGDAHPNEIAIAREGGATIRAVARSIVEPPPGVDDPHLQHMWWVTRTDSPIKTPEDIKRFPGTVKIQMIVRNACMDFLTDKLLEKYNIPREKFEYITMPDIEGIQALQQGLIEIAIPHPPFYKSVENFKANIIATSRDLGGENGGTYLYYFSDTFIKNNPEAVRRFIRAIKKAERWANDNPEQTAKWTEEAIGIPVEANHYYARTSAINDAHIAEWIQGAKNAGALEPGAKVTVADIVTHDFDTAGVE